MSRADLTAGKPAAQQSPAAAPTRPLRCAVIGVGRMGNHHAWLYGQTEGAELIGIVDADPVTIATPTVTHRAVAEKLLAARVACLIEKPLAPDLAEARLIADAASRS